MICLIFDEGGQRGYICKKGVPLHGHNGSKEWSLFRRLTTEDQRLVFIRRVLENSLKCSGIFSDMFPGNLVLCDDRISFIDFDSFRSFNFIFNGKREWYETFELDAWWKPIETARRDLDITLREYLKKCLNIDYVDNIKSKKNLYEIKNILKNRG